jgi:organic radical activating enzyme
MLHNTEQKKQDRLMMQQGQRPAGCEYCWKIEDMNVDALSDRPYKSMIYSPHDLRKAKNAPVEEDFNLKTLEISFDRTCQFACSYCNPGFSSTWVKDIKKNGIYKNLTTDGRSHFTHDHEHYQLYDINQTNPYVEAFFAWWEADLHKTLVELRITGGEPLMSGYTWKLLDWFKDHKNSSRTQLAINSNLGFEIGVLNRLLDSVSGNQLTLYTSNESMGKQAEYIRDGLIWEQWITNSEYLMQSKRLQSFNIMCTINALCLDTLTDFLDLVMDWKKKYSNVYFSLNIMRFPSFQGLATLPQNIRDHYAIKIEDWLARYEHDQTLSDLEKNHIKRLLNYLRVIEVPHGEGFDRNQAEKDFKNFFIQYDQRRGKCFEDTFSSLLVNWYQSIEHDE